MSGSYQKALLQFCAGTGDKDMALERVEAFYHDTQPVNGLRMNGAFTMFQNGAQTQLLRTPDVAWVYQVTTQHRVNFIPAGKSFAMRLWALDGRSWNLPMKKTRGCAKHNAHDIRVPPCFGGVFSPACGAGQG